MCDTKFVLVFHIALNKCTKVISAKYNRQSQTKKAYFASKSGSTLQPKWLHKQFFF